MFLLIFKCAIKYKNSCYITPICYYLYSYNIFSNYKSLVGNGLSYSRYRVGQLY